MKRKNSTLAFAFLLFSFVYSAAHSQGGYLNIGMGYAFPSAIQNLGTTQVGSTQELVVGSFGKGLNFGATIGYMMNENIGVELAFSYLSGGEYTFIDTLDITEKVSGSMIRLIPAL